MNSKHKKVCRVFNYIDHLLTVTSTVTECVSIPTFASLVGIPIGITSSTIGLNTCIITAGFKRYKSVQVKKKRHKIILWAKSKLNSIKTLISKALIDSNISHDEFVVMKVGKEFYDTKEEIKYSSDK